MTLLTMSSHTLVDTALAWCLGGHRFDSCQVLRFFFFVPHSQYVEYFIFHKRCIIIMLTLMHCTVTLKSGGTARDRNTFTFIPRCIHHVYLVLRTILLSTSSTEAIPFNSKHHKWCTAINNPTENQSIQLY